MREVEREEEGKVEAEWVGEERVGEERVEATEEAWVATRVGAMAVVEMAVVAREGEEMEGEMVVVGLEGETVEEMVVVGEETEARSRSSSPCWTCKQPTNLPLQRTQTRTQS